MNNIFKISLEDHEIYVGVKGFTYIGAGRNNGRRIPSENNEKVALTLSVKDFNELRESWLANRNSIQELRRALYNSRRHSEAGLLPVSNVSDLGQGDSYYYRNQEGFGSDGFARVTINFEGILDIKEIERDAAGVQDRTLIRKNTKFVASLLGDDKSEIEDFGNREIPPAEIVLHARYSVSNNDRNFINGIVTILEIIRETDGISQCRVNHSVLPNQELIISIDPATMQVERI